MKDEFGLMAQLEHEHVIRHLESYEDDKYAYIVMEAMEDAFEL
jgi:hypothetical protein